MPKKYNVIGTCPICSKNLQVTELTCCECGTKITGNFNLSRFDYLSDEQKEFALVFLKNGGNIKLIEKDLNISYPTVKKNLSDVIEALGFDNVNISKVTMMSKNDVYQALKNREISIDEAERILKEIGDEDE